MAPRTSSTRLPSLSTSSVLFRKSPRSSSAMRSRRILSSFLINYAHQTGPQPRRVWSYRLRTFPLSFSLISPTGTGSFSDSAILSTRGINCSIARRHASVCWDDREHHGWGGMRGILYIAMIQDFREAPANRLERGKGICGSPDQIDG